LFQRETVAVLVLQEASGKGYSANIVLFIQILLPSTPFLLIKLFWKETTSHFTVMQLVTQHQTSLGRKMAAQQCCIKERRTASLTYRNKLLEVTHVQLGMEWVNRKMLQLQLMCSVSYYFECFSNDFRKTKTKVMAWLLLTLTGKPLFFAQGIKITSALLLLQALYMA